MSTDVLIPWWPLIAALAVTRLAQLVVFDKVFDVPRDWLIDSSHARAAKKQQSCLLTPTRRPSRAWLAELITCIWCVSIWTAAVVVVGLWLVGPPLLWVLLVFALSEAASALNSTLDRM